MKAFVRIFPFVVIGILAAVAVVAKGGKAIVTPAGDVKWTENPARKGVWVAPLWGDPSKGAYGALKKTAAGTSFGWHTHSADQKVVAVAGTFDFQLEGDAAPKQLPPGSYVFVPAGTKHKTGCRPGADCVYFEEQPGKSDMVPVK